MIITMITNKCTTAIYSEKVLMCSLKDDADIFLNISNFSGIDKDYIKICGFKTFSAAVGYDKYYSIYPAHIKEVCDYYINERNNGTDTEDINKYLSDWLSKINEKVFNAFLGYSTAGIADGWITKSIGVDGLDINIELLARQIRMNDLVKSKEEINDGQQAESKEQA